MEIKVTERARVEDLNRGKVDRAVYSKHIQDNLVTIITTYCQLLKRNLVKDSQNINQMYQEIETEMKLEDYISMKIDQSLEKDKNLKKGKPSEKNLLSDMVEDIISSYIETHSVSKDLSDKLVYLKVSVDQPHPRSLKSKKS